MSIESGLARRMKEDISKAVVDRFALYEAVSVTDSTVTISTRSGPRTIAKIAGVIVTPGSQVLVINPGGGMIAIGTVGTDAESSAPLGLLPSGGSAGAKLVKASSANYDAVWQVDAGTGVIYGTLESTTFSTNPLTTATGMPSAGWPLLTGNIPALENGVTYVVVAHAFVEGYANTAWQDGKLYISLSGNITTGPNVVFEAGINGPKTQMHIATRVGDGNPFPVAFRCQYVGTGTGTIALEWAKMTVIAIPISVATGGGGGAANWGSIGGSISSQSDLTAALDAKLNKPSPTIGWATGRYYGAHTNPGNVVASGTLAMAANRHYCIPMYIEANASFDRVATNITVAGTSGAAITVGIYEMTSSGAPGALVQSVGNIPATATGEAFVTAAGSLTGGKWYWCVAAANQTVTINTVRTAISPMGNTAATDMVPTFPRIDRANTAMATPYGTPSGFVTSGPLLSFRAA